MSTRLEHPQANSASEIINTSTAQTVCGNPAARVWLFDFDNTLVALERAVDWAASRRELESFLRSEGVDDGLFTEFPRRNLTLYNALLHRMLAKHIDNNGRPAPLSPSLDAQALLRRASAIIESYERRGAVRATALAGAEEMIRALRDCAKSIAIVTSNSSQTVADWFANHGLTSYLTAIVGRDSLLPLKPSPAMVLRALELTKCSPSDAVLVGDSEADFHASCAAQVRFYGIGAEVDARAHLTSLGAREVFSSPAELATHIGLKLQIESDPNA